MRPETVPVYTYSELEHVQKRCRVCKCKLRNGEIILEINGKPCHRFCVHAVLQDSYTEFPQLPSEDASLSPEGAVEVYRQKLLEQWHGEAGGD